MSVIFQYGSNCTAARLNSPRRLNGHATDFGKAQTVGEYEIAFNVPSQTNGCAAADLVKADGTGRHAWGVLYEVADEFIRGKRTDGQKTLEQIEGTLYEEKRILVRNEVGEEIEAITFLAKSKQPPEELWTSVAYVSYIVYGLRAHRVSEDYIIHITKVAVQTNERAGEIAREQTRLIKYL